VDGPLAGLAPTATASDAGWAKPHASRGVRNRRREGGARSARWIAEVFLTFTGIRFEWLTGRKRSRKRLLGSLGLVCAGFAVVVFVAPLAWAGRASLCEAAEVALVDEAIGRGSRFEESKRRVGNWAGPDGKLLSHGRVGRQIAAEEHAGWPLSVGCTVLFWRARSDAASFGGFTAVLSRALSARR